MAIASLALSLWLAARLPLVDPDEGRNAEVAREMAAGGDLVIPHLAGMPYLDKPPALYWAAAAAIRVLGATPLAARLPSILAGLATLLVLGGFARRAAGGSVAWRAAALLAAAPLFAVISAYAIFDVPLALCVTLVWVGLADELREGPRGRRRASMFAAVGLGLLLKGPVMLAWALGGSAATALLVRSRAPLRWLAWWPGWLLALGLAGAWFGLACARHPEYPRYAFLEESLERMTRGSFRREQPWWFVPAVLVVGALPWSLASPWGERRLREAPEGARQGIVVALGFALFALAFFTLSRSKLVTYLVPALPPLAWLAALCWSHPAPARRPAVVLGVLLVLLALAGAAVAMSAPYVTYVPGADPGPEALRALVRGGWALALGLAPVAVLAFAGLARRPLALAAALAFTPVTLAFGHPLLLDAARRSSGAPLAAAIRAAGGGAVAYQRCYSPGTDYLLGRASWLVSAKGEETTSNYQVRYAATLRRRGLWTPLDAAPAGATIVVRPARDAGTPPPAGMSPFHRDARFVAYRIAPPR